MEQIPLSLVLTDAMMGCPTYYRLQDNTLVSERTIRIITYSIAEIMSITGRVAEVILALILMHPAGLEEAMWIICWQYITLFVNDDNRLWHFSKLLHIIRHHGYTRWQWVLLAFREMLILQSLVVLIPLKLTAPDTTEVAVNLAIIILEHTRVDAV